MSRASANLLLGVVIGTCAVVVATKIIHSRRQGDPRLIARRLGKRMRTLESRVGENLRATAG